MHFESSKARFFHRILSRKLRDFAPEFRTLMNGNAGGPDSRERLCLRSITWVDATAGAVQRWQT
jgi:hypothetical protein